MDLISRQAAIDALGEQPVIWQDSEYEIGRQNQYDSDVSAIENVPTIDAVQVIRCKDCKNWDRSWKSTSPDHHYCPFIDWPTSESFYCAKAERRTDADE